MQCSLRNTKLKEEDKQNNGRPFMVARVTKLIIDYPALNVMFAGGSIVDTSVRDGAMLNIIWTV